MTDGLRAGRAASKKDAGVCSPYERMNGYNREQAVDADTQFSGLPYQIGHGEMHI